jgi:hypothetical protein
MFQNSVMKRIIGPRRDKVTGKWKRLHSGELHNFISKYHLADQIKANQMGGVCGTHGRGQKTVQGCSGKDLRKESTRKTKK